MIQLIKDLLLILVSLITFLTLLTALVSIFFLQVPYVPTQRKVIKKIIEIGNFQKNQKLYDLGCGDAGLLLEAEQKTGIQGVGYEIAPIPYLLAQLKKIFFKSNIQIHLKNFFKIPLANADIIYCYLTPEVTQKVAEKALKECKKGTKIICNTFQIKNLKPTKIFEKNLQQKLPSLYLYEI